MSGRPGRLVDAHCHLGDGAFDGDRDAVRARAEVAGIGHIVVIGDRIATSREALTLARSTPGLSATAGIHPHQATEWSVQARAEVVELLGEPEVVAVGETGLDYHYDHSPRPTQIECFEGHLALAERVRKPVVVHAREADADVARLLRSWGPRVPAIILHSFSSGPDLFAAGMEIGAYFSFSGMITFKSWGHPEYLTVCPADRLLVETDAPYLAPVPHRGSRNEPAFVRETALALARARGVTLEALVPTLTANAARVFGPRVTPSP
ncbi:MAG TPA: TatD family hydrolase [Gemmatimonadales bacterium]|nr:TatD family hydrolase [Gemmatimonadales bacterium]